MWKCMELCEIYPVNNQVDMEGRKYGLLEYGKAERKCRGFSTSMATA